MNPQNYEKKNAAIRKDFLELKRKHPQRLAPQLNLSWSNWGFGIEPLATSAARLAKHGVTFIELHGNHYGPDLGYKPKETITILGDHGIKVAGVCGMFSADNDLSSNRAIHRQAALDYIRRELEFAQAVGGGYLLVVPGAVGRPKAYDASEFHRSTETLRIVGGDFVQAGVRAAIEPIRAAEVSFCHTIADAHAYLAAVNHPGVSHINGDVYHMQSGEAHIGEAVRQAGERLTNLHLADSNRCALGEGALDVDTLIMALYCIGYNQAGCYVTPEPLGPGGDPYPAMNGKPDPQLLDRLVGQTVRYFREREDVVRNECDAK
jgi:sugar phosphate isomerase/epimerase